MRKISKAIPIPQIRPLHLHPDVRAASARLDVLRARWASLEQRRHEAEKRGSDADIARLLADPSAPVVPAADPRQLPAEQRVIQAAISAAEHELPRVRAAASIEYARDLRDMKTELTEQLLGALEQAQRLVSVEVALNAQLDQAGYSSWEAVLPRLANHGDLNAIASMISPMGERLEQHAG